MSELEEALTLRPNGDGGWFAVADPRYESITGMFGGWAAALLLRGAIRSAAGDATPSAITVNYIAKVEPASDVIVTAHHVGGGRSIHHWRVDLMSADDRRTLAQSMVVLAERRATDGHTEPTMPDAPDPETLGEFHPPGSQGERILHRPVSGYPPFGRDATASVAWVREMTGRRVDPVQLAFLADAYAPRSFFWSEGPRPSATMSMSVYFHASDEEIDAVGDDYVLNEAVGTRGAQSTSGQQARLWSRTGDLLVTTQQLCWYR
jgi:acyl-CoA thioesterase